MKYKSTKYLLIFLVLVFIDQISKYLIRHTGGFYVCNKNIAFGINIPEIIFWIFWIAIVIFLIHSLLKKYQIQNTIYQILILSGALSNIIDRLRFGCVVDFIDLKIWPVFNLADTYITVGAMFIIFSLFKKPKSVS